MASRPPRWTLLPSIALGAAVAACAQQPPVAGARPADPLDPRAAVAPAVHRSPLTAYRPFADQPVDGWREANDAVARIGGWRWYAREAQPAASTPPPPAGGASAPKTP